MLKNTNQNFILLSVFAVILLVGIYVFDDFGISWDEPTQRTHSLVNAKKILNTFGVELSGEPYTNLPAIEDYDGKYYGTAIQMPAVTIEIGAHFYGRPMTFREIFLVRHFFTFFLYFISLICFYFLCVELFGSKYLAILGVLMIYAYPRYFAHAYYNIKDLNFSSLLVISLYASVLFLKRKELKYVFFSGFALALATNSRFFTLVLLAGVISILVLEEVFLRLNGGENIPDRREKGLKSWKGVLYGALLLIWFAVSYVLLTPASWGNPFLFLYDYVYTFTGFEGWNNLVAFQGKYIFKDELPRTYLITWLGISLPIVYIILALLGIVLILKESFLVPVSELFRKVYENRFLLLPLGLFSVAFSAPLLKQGLLYDEWRHLYFIFPLIIIFCLFAIKAVWEGVKNPRWKYAPIAAVALSIVFQFGWMIKNHPFENVYLNVIGAQYGANFERDYWGLSQYQMLNFIAEKLPEKKIFYVAAEPDSKPLESSVDMLPEFVRNRFIVVHDLTKAEFVFGNFRMVRKERLDLVLGFYIKNEFWVAGFQEIYSIKVDGYKIGLIMARY